MRLFECLVEGENFAFLKTESGDRQLMGFFVTRWTYAASVEEAKAYVLRSLHKELEDSLDDGSLWPDFKIRFEDVVEVGQRPEADPGFVWFQMGA